MITSSLKIMEDHIDLAGKLKDHTVSSFGLKISIIYLPTKNKNIRQRSFKNRENK